ncbi:hypothetical protein C8Q78DRAFT_1083339 [Trametes maxima]|nr:hypothetical protein C8Q78DRAFT_1083339 [Trametes maxima]
MQFKTALVVASVAAAALAAPAADVQQHPHPSGSFTLTTAVTTQTFTASVVLQSFEPSAYLRSHRVGIIHFQYPDEPWVTTISTDDVFTVTRTVTKEVEPTSPPTPQA